MQLACSHCQESYWAIFFFENKKLKLGNLYEAARTRVKAFLITIILLAVIWVGFSLATKYIFELLSRINGLLLIWILLGGFLLLHSIQMIILLILKEEKKGLKVLKVERNRQ